jgi:hypothetical protein
MITYALVKCKEVFVESINKLNGHKKRIALAKLSKAIGRGGSSIVAKEFNVSRDTIRKGFIELETGEPIKDNFCSRGRKKTSEKSPNLLDDIKEIVDIQSQIDPKFKSTNIYTRLTVAEIRKQLITDKGYKEEDLPTNATLNTITNNLGYKLRKVKKTKPIKKIKETDVIFENLAKIHTEYANKENVVRISIDTKDKVKIGNFSRGGYSRCNTTAFDHDFGNEFITPFGILDVTNEKVSCFFTESKVTADFMVDAIETYWVESGYSQTKDTIIINADNGSENNSHRTQFIKRIVEFSIKYDVKVIMAYYPPYHSKYNPIERTWGVLEKHWNGSILDSKEAVLGYASSMTWKGKNPEVKYIDKIYETGIKVNKHIMKLYESVLERMTGIEKWYLEINPHRCKEVFDMEIKV